MAIAKFTTRVELHNAHGEDYEKLHIEMEKEGFSRTIVSNEGKKYQLPTAEYNKEGNYNYNQVLESAKQATHKVDKVCSIIVSQTMARTWIGLKEIS